MLEKITQTFARTKSLVYRGSDQDVQSGVAILLFERLGRCQCMVIQRAIREGDPNSGDVALPGGKCENGEDSLQAAIRQTQEEIGINLSTQGSYLGAVSHNYLVRVSKNKKRLWAAAHIFKVPENLSYKLQETEVSLFRNIQIDNFFDPKYFTYITEKLKDSGKKREYLFNSSTDMNLDIRAIHFPGVQFGF